MNKKNKKHWRFVAWIKRTLARVDERNALGLLIVVPVALYFGHVLLRPCTGTGPSTCAVYCTGVGYEGDVYTYVCGEEPCVVCTQRDWFWKAE